MVWAEDNFKRLCPDVESVDIWCMSPPSEGVCCGICPNGGISGLSGYGALAFNSLCSIGAIALEPSSAPMSLFTNLLQATASPPWAVTGEEDPTVLADMDRRDAMRLIRQIEVVEGSDSDSSESDDEHSHLTRRKRRKARARKQREHWQLQTSRYNALVRAFQLRRERKVSRCCGVTVSHMLLYLGFAGSLALWTAAFFIGILGGLTGSTKVTLSQPNCTASLGGARLLFYAASCGQPTRTQRQTADSPPVSRT
ncbi:hypothetical protein ACM66B_000870 [Microbotryomycetes sp. NB124-2]